MLPTKWHCCSFEESVIFLFSISLDNELRLRLPDCEIYVYLLSWLFDSFWYIVALYTGYIYIYLFISDWKSVGYKTQKKNAQKIEKLAGNCFYFYDQGEKWLWLKRTPGYPVEINRGSKLLLRMCLKVIWKFLSVGFCDKTSYKMSLKLLLCHFFSLSRRWHFG